MNRPALTALSLSAGVQSTTIALLAVKGFLPRLTWRLSPIPAGNRPLSTPTSTASNPF